MANFPDKRKIESPVISSHDKHFAFPFSPVSFPKYNKNLSCVLHRGIPVNTPRRQKPIQVLLYQKNPRTLPEFLCFLPVPGAWEETTWIFLCTEAESCCHLLVLLVWDSASSTPALPKIETLQNEAKRPPGTRSPARDARAQ